MKISLSFFVCRGLHERRTRSLWEVLCKPFLERNPDCDVKLFGGFDQFDDIPIVRVSERDDYLSCIDKMYGLMMYHKETDYDWYFIGDDDTFINFGKLEKLISGLDVEAMGVYGLVAPIFEAPNLYHVHGGTGILMSKKVLREIVKGLELNGYLRHHLNGDVSLGMNIYKYNLTIGKESGIIKFVHVSGMATDGLFRMGQSIEDIDVGAFVTIHTKDNVSVEYLAKRVGWSWRKDVGGSNIGLGFLVCRELHEKRTRELWEVVCKPYKERNKRVGIYLFGGFDQFDDIPIVRVSEKDDYLSCIDKTFKGLEYFKDKNHEWYFLGDDDTYVNTERLEQLVSELDVEDLALYGFNFCYDGLLHMHGGAGILMNKRTLGVLLKYVERNGWERHFKHSDLSLGMTIKKYNQSGVDKVIKFRRVEGMVTPWCDVGESIKRVEEVLIDSPKKYGDIITLHTKDRIRFSLLDSIIRGS